MSSCGRDVTSETTRPEVRPQALVAILRLL